MSKLKASDAMKLDLYGLLKLKIYSKEKEIKRAYRKQALKLHPDKNPNNPRAAKNFQNLQKALELLTDPIEKEEYDRLLRAKEAAEERRREQDAQTRGFREKLEKREAELKRQKEQKDEYQEIERVRRRAEREEEERVMVEERRESERRREREKERELRKTEFNVKVKWSKGCVVDADDIKEIFSKYGAVKELVMRDKVALVQYDKQLAAVRSLEENKDGGRRLKVELMFQVDYEQADDDEDFEVFEKHFLEVLHRKSQLQAQQENSQQPQQQQFKIPQQQKPQQQQSTNLNRDFESLHDRSLRQAEERKRIIEEIMKSEA